MKLKLMFTKIMVIKHRTISDTSKGFQISESGKFWLVESGIQQIFLVESES